MKSGAFLWVNTEQVQFSQATPVGGINGDSKTDKVHLVQEGWIPYCWKIPSVRFMNRDSVVLETGFSGMSDALNRWLENPIISG